MVRRMQQEARDDPDGFWANEAERLPWFKKWDTVFDWTPIKPGSAGIPMPGWDVEVVDDDGKAVGPGVKGIVIIKRPFPSMLPTIWNDPERYARDYWSKLPGVYYTGDAAEYDEDGY